MQHVTHVTHLRTCGRTYWNVANSYVCVYVRDSYEYNFWLKLFLYAAAYGPELEFEGHFLVPIFIFLVAMLL